MAIDTIKSWQEFTSDGTTAYFAFNFNYDFNRPEDIMVGIRTGDNTYTVVAPEHYELTPNASEDGGQIRFIQAIQNPIGIEIIDKIPAAGEIIRIERKSSQTSSATWQIGLDMTTLVNLFDRLFRLTQENKGRFDNTIKTFATQHNIKLFELLAEHNNTLLFWDDENKTLTPTEFPKKDIVRAKDGLFFRITADERSNVYLEWSENGITNWHSMNFGKIEEIAEDAKEIAQEAKVIAETADNKSTSAIQTANEAKNTAETALANSQQAIETSNTALENSEEAKRISETANDKADLARADANEAKTIANNANIKSNQAVAASERAEQKAEQAIATAEQAVETSEQALAVANSANQKSDTAVATANEASSVANTALSNSQQAVSTANSASAKADEALTASARAESKSDNAVATAGRAESSAAQAVSTSNQALENSEQALADVQSAVEAAQRATEAAESAEQAVQEYDGRIQQAQDDAASALSLVGDKVGFTDYATNNAAGVIKTSDIYAVSTTTSGAIFAQTRTAAQYESFTNNNAFISRGTLENIKTNLVASVGDAKYQGKLTPGTNITIDDNNVISATGGGAVESVNGKTGVVVLTGDDISADVSELTDTVQGHLQTLHDNIKDIELFKFPNATIIGEPTIDHGQVSGFSESNYLQFPFIVDLHNQPFVIDFCFTTGNNVTTQQNILDSQFGLALAIANGKGLMAISHNGTSWAGSVAGTIAIQPNTTYYARLSWNRILYKTELSTDGTTYTSDMTFGSTQSPYPRTMFIGGCSGSAIGHAAHPFGGSINLNYAYLTVAGNVIWQGMDDAGLSTRADVSLGNLDEFGQAKFDAKQDVISDLATIRSNASAGKSASDTIAGYGNIVTHNANEFQPAGDYALKSEIPTVPTNVSAFTNDSGYITKSVNNLNNYTTTTALNGLLANKQNKLIAGENITIDESTNTISATGGSDGETIKNQNASSSIEKTYDWTGTLKEAEDQNVRELHPDWKIYITDDVSGGSDRMYTKTEVDTGFVAKGHEVIAFQAPTSANNYAWYRKYADGWVEQGGIIPAQTAATITITLPVEMVDSNWYFSTSGSSSSTSDGVNFAQFSAWDRTTTEFKTRSNSTSKKNWEVKGMAV